MAGKLVTLGKLLGLIPTPWTKRGAMVSSSSNSSGGHSGIWQTRSLIKCSCGGGGGGAVGLLHLIVPTVVVLLVVPLVGGIIEIIGILIHLLFKVRRQVVVTLDPSQGCP